MEVKRTVRLADFLTPYRIEHRIVDNVVYRQVTISKTGTISFRGEKVGAEIGRKRQFRIDLSKYPNTILFTRQGLLEGAIGIAPKSVDQCVVTENMPMMAVNTEIVSVEYLKKLLVSEYLFEKIRELKIVGSAQKSIHERDLLKVEIELPPMKEQKVICKSFRALDSEQNDLSLQLLHQQNLLKKLRQQILQEAIEGKITADWREQNPDVEPASELLARIKAEKEQLIKDKKIKKQKALPPITDEKKPFDLPVGWEWCRLGEISNLLNGYAFKSEWFTKKGVKLVRNTNVSHGVLNWNEKACISHEVSEEYNRFLLEEGDTVLSLDRPIISTGLKAARIQRVDLPCLLLQRVLLIKSVFVCEDYVFKWLFSELFLGSINPGRSMGVPHVSHNEVMSAPFPLPPLTEQKVIVAKVEKLLAICDQLEAQITSNQTHAEQLMEAVLKEAFQQSSTELTCEEEAV